MQCSQSVMSYGGFVRGVAADGCMNETQLGRHDQELCLYLKDTKGEH